MVSKLDAAVSVVGIAAEVDTKDASVGVAREVALYVVYQSGVFAQSQIESAIHTRSAQHIIK